MDVKRHKKFQQTPVNEDKINPEVTCK